MLFLLLPFVLFIHNQSNFISLEQNQFKAKFITIEYFDHVEILVVDLLVFCYVDDFVRVCVKNMLLLILFRSLVPPLALRSSSGAESLRMQ